MESTQDKSRPENRLLPDPPLKKQASTWFFAEDVAQETIQCLPKLYDLFWGLMVELSIDANSHILVGCYLAATLLINQVHWDDL